MNVKKLEQILNEEANFCMDIVYDNEMRAKDGLMFSKSSTLEKIEEDIKRIWKLIHKKKPKNLWIKISHPKKIIEQGKTYGGEQAQWEQRKFNVEIFHLIPSKIEGKYHKILNTTIKLDFTIKRNINNRGWEFYYHRNEPEVSMNQAFNKTLLTTECNSVYLLKYLDLEFIVYEEDTYNLNRLVHDEGDVIPFQAERYVITDNTTLNEDLDFITTDGAMRFYIKQNLMRS